MVGMRLRKLGGSWDRVRVVGMRPRKLENSWEVVKCSWEGVGMWSR